jgi:UDP-N-acetylglucosamine acyltransferase
MNSVISQDVPPFVTVAGHMAKPYGLNAEGLKRRGFSSDTLSGLKKAYKILYRSGNSLDQAVAAMQELANQHAEVHQLVEFLKNVSRGIVR